MIAPLLLILPALLVIVGRTRCRVVAAPARRLDRQRRQVLAAIDYSQLRYDSPGARRRLQEVSLHVWEQGQRG